MNFEKKLNEMLNAARQRTADRDAYLTTQPQERPCDRHPDVVRAIDRDNTRPEGTGWAVAYAPCPRCLHEKRFAEQNERLHAAGVPRNLLHASFENWTPSGEQDEAVLTKVAAFFAARKGFLFLIGHNASPEDNVGCGKSHLAVGIMRGFTSPRFTKQQTFLLGLRASYRDRNAEDVIEACKDADLFVLDEVGLSAGGKDELPALHEVLDHRYGEQLPTVITSNLDWQGIKAVFGPRLSDRFSECATVLTFQGKSHRRARRDSYLASNSI